MAAGDEDRGEGMLDRAKGKMKKVIGEITDDPSKKAEGSVDKAKGSLKKTKGDVKDRLDEDVKKI